MFTGSLRSALLRYGSGTDLSKQLRLPHRLESLLSDDRIAYALHLTVARTMERLRLLPTVVAVAWLKAAAHARSERALHQVVEGMVTTAARSSNESLRRQLHVAVVGRVTCHGKDVVMRRRQLWVLASAGMPVGDGTSSVAALDSCARCSGSPKLQLDDHR